MGKVGHGVRHAAGSSEAARLPETTR